MIQKQDLRSITAIEFITLFLYIVTALAFLWMGKLKLATSVAVGGTLALVNFDLLKRILLAVIQGSVVVRGVFGAFYWVKFMILSAVIFVLIYRGMVQPIGLVIGLSSLVTAIVIYALYHQIRLIRHPELGEEEQPQQSEEDRPWPRIGEGYDDE